MILIIAPYFGENMIEINILILTLSLLGTIFFICGLISSPELLFRCLFFNSKDGKIGHFISIITTLSFICFVYFLAFIARILTLMGRSF